MFAFKVLNLKTYSKKLILILLALSGGLISLIFASPITSDIPIPHIPVPGLIFWLSFNYALYGATFSAINKINSAPALFLTFNYMLTLILPLLILRYELYFVSLIVSLISFFIMFLLYKKFNFAKKAFFCLSIHFVTGLYLFYLSFSFIS